MKVEEKKTAKKRWNKKQPGARTVQATLKDENGRRGDPGNSWFGGGSLPHERVKEGKKDKRKHEEEIATQARGSVLL